jgi:hypothetical protein
MSTWDGKPPCAGWHWLERRRDGAWRMACYADGFWHVSDSIGRTLRWHPTRICRLYAYGLAVPEPPAGAISITYTCRS